MGKVYLVLDRTQAKSQELHDTLVQNNHIEAGTCITLAMYYNAFTKHPENFTRDIILRYCATPLQEDAEPKEYFLIINFNTCFQYGRSVVEALIKANSLRNKAIPRFIPIVENDFTTYTDLVCGLPDIMRFLHKRILMTDSDAPIVIHDPLPQPFQFHS